MIQGDLEVVARVDAVYRPALLTLQAHWHGGPVPVAFPVGTEARDGTPAASGTRRANPNLLAAKDNQPTLHTDIPATFTAVADDPNFEAIVDFVETMDRGRGRREHRRCHVCYDLKAISRKGEWARPSPSDPAR